MEEPTKGDEGATVGPASPWDDVTVSTAAARSPRSRKQAVGVSLAALLVAIGGFFGFRQLTSSGTGAALASSNGPGGSGFRQGPGGFGGRGTFGTLTSVSGSTLTLQGVDNLSTTVDTSGTTVFAKTTAGALSYLAVGDKVSVIGASNGTNGLTADRITDSGNLDVNPGDGRGAPPMVGGGGNGAGPGEMISGTIASINGDTIGVTTTSAASVSVETSTSTTFSLVRASSLNALTTGETLQVRGTRASDGTVAASSVVEGVTMGNEPGATPPMEGR